MRFTGTENIKQIAVDPNKPAYDPKQSKAEQKIDLYCDQREQRSKNGESYAVLMPLFPADEDMATWDLNTLERVVKEKHSADSCTTDIICKYFLSAVESKVSFCVL